MKFISNYNHLQNFYENSPLSEPMLHDDSFYESISV